MKIRACRLILLAGLRHVSKYGMMANAAVMSDSCKRDCGNVSLLYSTKSALFKVILSCRLRPGHKLDVVGTGALTA